jgi:hypothetical protein
VVRREVKMVDAEARAKPPFIDLIFPRVNVFGSSGLVLEPVVKPATNDGDTVR